MSDTLVKAILRLAVAGPTDNAAAANAVQTLKRARPIAWRRAEQELRLHQIAPLAWHGLRNHALTDAPPQDVAEALVAARRNTLFRTMAFFDVLGTVLDALADAGVTPTLWKGIALAACYYPDPSLRPMDDIDLAVEGDQAETVRKVFKFLVYRDVSTTADAVYYQNDAGIAFDVHHRVRLFEGHEKAGMTTEVRSPHLGDRPLRILAPEAMITHLVCHARGHRPDTGYVLRWIADLHFVLLHTAAHCDVDKLKALLPTPADARLYLRLMRFLGEYFGTPIPQTLVSDLRSVSRLSLEEVLRSRRLAMWGLPGPRGFARLLAGRTQTPTGERRPWPRVSDLVCWPGDVLRERSNQFAQSWRSALP